MQGNLRGGRKISPGILQEFYNVKDKVKKVKLSL
jgi:hypothetical protein